MWPFWQIAVCILVEHIIDCLAFLPRNYCSLHALDTKHQFFIMKEEFVHKSWVFYTTIPTVL